MDIDNYLYAAAYHNIITIKRINRIRLNAYDIKEYYNSGVLLMNLKLQRETISEEEIFDFVKITAQTYYAGSGYYKFFVF